VGLNTKARIGIDRLVARYQVLAITPANTGQYAPIGPVDSNVHCVNGSRVGGRRVFSCQLIPFPILLILLSWALPLLSQTVSQGNSSNPTNPIIADNSKTFLDYVKAVQDEDKAYRESVEGFFTKITYVLTLSGVLLGGLVAFVGFNTNKGVQKWLEANFNRMAGHQIEEKTAALYEHIAAAQKEIEVHLDSAKKAELRLTQMAEKADFNISYFFVTDEGWEILKKLAADGAAHYGTKEQPQIKDNLRRLRDRLELIEMQQKPGGGNYTVAKMPDEGDLKTFCKLTKTGRDFIDRKLKEESRPQ